MLSLQSALPDVRPRFTPRQLDRPRFTPRRTSPRVGALLVAVQAGNEDEVRRCLDDATVDMEAADKDGLTSLHLGCQAGHLELVSMLIERGASVHTLSKAGKSPLYACCAHGHSECLSLLLAVGAAFDEPRQNGARPLAVACEARRQGASNPRRARASAPPCFCSHTLGVHVLGATQHGHVECVRMLLSQGAEVDSEMFDGATPLFISCEAGHQACASLLLDHGASADKADKKGVTPLAIGRKNGNAACVTRLERALARTELCTQIV